MLHVTTIENALDTKDRAAIEAAFRTFVQWPQSKGVQGAEDAEELMALLDRVTAALEADRNPMPEDLATSIIEQGGDGFWLRDDRSYATGARAVAAKSMRWRAILKAHLGVADESPVDADPYPTAY